MAEVLTALLILVLLAGGVGMTLRGIGKVNACNWARQCCTAAGQGQLDSIAVTGQPIGEAEIERLWPGVQVHVEKRPGSGDWEGLTLVKVTAETVKYGKEIRIELARYINE